MEREEIRISQGIIHILDSAVGMPVLSDVELEHGSDFHDFLKSHIGKIIDSDDKKSCSFEEESRVYSLIREWDPKQFVPVSQEIARLLYPIMNQNIAIPSADLMVVAYTVRQHPYLALLKMNYRTSYTHMTHSDPWGNNNDVVKQKAILPGENQRIYEAALIDLKDCSLKVLEKKYEVNGVKTDYFSSLFLQCKGSLSPRTKLAIVNRTVEDIQKKYYNDSEQFEVRMEAKSIINRELEEKGELDVPHVVEHIFRGQDTLRQEAEEKLTKWNLIGEPVKLENPNTAKKYTKQHLLTDTGIEIKIPMEEYYNKDRVEFITNSDGSISVLIKNVGSITSR